MNKSHLICALCAVLLAAIPLRIAHAITIKLEFEVSNFVPSTGEGSAPQEIVSGSILYDAFSTTSTIDSINAIDLMIVDYTYATDDVGYIRRINTPTECIGDGVSNGVCNVGASPHDFMMRWEQETLVAKYFAYSTGLDGVIWGTSTFDLFTITAVPIPPSLFLFGSGLLGLVGMSKCKKKA